MSDTSNDNCEKNKGFHINSDGISCIPCRCKRQFYHKETKTIKEDNKITTNTVIDKRNTKFGENNIFQAENQLGSVEICDTGWNNQQNRITPEEVEEQVDELRVEVKEIKSDVEKLKSNLNIMD